MANGYLAFITSTMCLYSKLEQRSNPSSEGFNHSTHCIPAICPELMAQGSGRIFSLCADLKAIHLCNVPIVDSSINKLYAIRWKASTFKRIDCTDAKHFLSALLVQIYIQQQRRYTSTYISQETD